MQSFWPQFASPVPDPGAPTPDSARTRFLAALKNFERVALALDILGATELGEAERAVIEAFDAALTTPRAVSEGSATALHPHASEPQLSNAATGHFAAAPSETPSGEWLPPLASWTPAKVIAASERIADPAERRWFLRTAFEQRAATAGEPDGTRRRERAAFVEGWWASKNVRDLVVVAGEAEREAEARYPVAALSRSTERIGKGR